METFNKEFLNGEISDAHKFFLNKLSKEEFEDYCALISGNESDGNTSIFERVPSLGIRALYPILENDARSTLNEMYKVGKSWVPKVVYNRMNDVFNYPQNQIDIRSFVSESKKITDATAAIVWTKNCHQEYYDNCPSLSQQIHELKGYELDEPEGKDKSWSHGTAFLIADDLLLTAAHNLCTESSNCEDDDFRYVFGFHFTPQGRSRHFKYFRIFRGRRLATDSTTGDDWRLVKLEASPGIKPIQTDLNIPYPNTHDWVWGTGFPGGIPQRISPLGQVTKIETPRSIFTNLDFFGGNSGSPVLSIKENKLVGLLVKGSDDYEVQAEKVKFKRILSEPTFSGAEGEQMHAIAAIAKGIRAVLEKENLNYPNLK